MKFNFIKHPGKVYPFFNNSDLYVDYSHGFYLYSSGVHKITADKLGKSGYILSKQLYPMFNTSGAHMLSFSLYWGFSSIGGHVFYNEAGAYLYSNKLDIGFLLPYVSYIGENRYTAKSGTIDSISYDSPVIYESTYKEEDEVGEDSVESKPEPTPKPPVEVSLNYPCWYSETLLGEYAPYWGAEGTITIGKKETDTNGETKFVDGNKYELVYIGSLPVWN